MPTTDTFGTPPGGTLYGRAFEAITEAFGGNGFPNSGNGEITPGSSSMTVDVSGGSVKYDGTVYNVSGTTLTVPSAPTTTTNGQEDKRVDIVVFDSNSESFTLIEGTSDPNPIPPSTPNDALLVGFVEVGNGVNDVTGDDVLNWRAVPAASFPVQTADIGDGAVTKPKIATDAVGSNELIDAAVTAQELADGAVTTSKIGDEQVTEAKIDPDVDLGGGGANLSVTDDGVIIESTTETLNAGAGVSAVADGTGKVTLLLEQNADGSYAQMLSRRHNDLRASEIQHATGVSARKSQVLARRNSG